MDVHTLLSPPLAEAFERVYMADNDEEKIEEFASTWGGIREALLEKVIATGKGKDKVLALFAAGYAALPSLENILLAHLHSPVQKERWAAALALGSRKEERAFPFLEAILQEGLARDETMQERTVPEIWDEYWYDRLRPRAVSLLADWKQPSLVPTMRHAFQLVWEAEKKGMPFLFGHGYQDALAYALGQRKAFGVLTGLDLPPTHFKTGMLYLALGYLQIRKRPPREGDLMMNEKLQQEVAEVLQQYFGLSPDEHAEYIENFYKNSVNRLLFTKSVFPKQKKDEPEEDEDEDEEDEDERDTAISPVLSCVYRGHKSDITTLDWACDGTRIASGDTEGHVHVWEATTGTLLFTVAGHQPHSVMVVAWSPDTRFLATGGSDSVVRVWNAQNGELHRVYTGHTAWICQGLCWSPDSMHLASGSWDGTVHVWNVVSGETLCTYRGHRGIVYSVAWSPDGTTLASGGGYPECEVHVWDAFTGHQQFVYRGHTQEYGEVEKKGDTIIWQRGASSVHSLAWSPNGRYIASAGLRWVSRVWEATSGKDISVSCEQTGSPQMWSADSRTLFSVALEGGVDRRNATTHERIARFVVPGLAHINTLGLSADGTQIAASGHRQEIFVWSI